MLLGEELVVKNEETEEALSHCGILNQVANSMTLQPLET